MIDLAHKKLFLLDMDGTLYLGDRLFEGVREFLQLIRARGGRYLFATNNSSRGVRAYVERLAGMGIEAQPEDFLTSVDAAIWYLRSFGYGRERIYAFGTRTFRQQLQEAGFQILDHLEDGIPVLLCGFDTELTFRKLEDACILLSRGAQFLATNPDWVCPTPYGSVPDCGSVCEMLTRATGKKPRFIGKPEPAMAFLAMEKFGCTKEETLIVGDRIYTDIACGANAGVDTAFVLSGEGVVEDIVRCGIRPTQVFRDVEEIRRQMAAAPGGA